MIKTSPPIKVLLVDDHAVVRVGIRELLDQASGILVVAEADDGETARQLIQEEPPDVLVLDIRLPSASGIDVARWAREAYPDMAILILSAYDDTPFVAAALQAGVNGYILKTASPEVIVQGIRDVYAGKSGFDDAMAHKVMNYIAGKPGPTVHFDALTEREMEVLSLAGQGYTNKAIGEQLDISGRTVQGHLARIFKKLGVNGRTEAVMKAVALGLIVPESQD
jgi:DNA-binding NarL/FixJ family response regulator